MRDRIKYTIGLVCGHMKIARFLESIALQSGTTVDDIRNFNFRIKEPDLAARNYVAEFTLRNGCSVRKAWWDLVDGDWGAGFFQNSACNFCDDVVAETADISLGDAWVEPYASDPEGNNVLIVRSEAFHRILENGVRKNKLCLKTVGPDFVEQTQTAGFRQRREGLAYRLCCSHSDNIPRKRVAPECKDLPFTRRIIYRTRKHISFWSHRVFRMAVAARCPALYDKWARFLSGLYQGITYKRGPLGAFLKSVEFYSK